MAAAIAEQLPDHFAAEQERRDRELAAMAEMQAQRERLIEERKQKELAARQRIEDGIRERDQRREEVQRETWASFERKQAAIAASRPKPRVPVESGPIQTPGGHQASSNLPTSTACGTVSAMPTVGFIYLPRVDRLRISRP